MQTQVQINYFLDNGTDPMLARAKKNPKEEPRNQNAANKSNKARGLCTGMGDDNTWGETH